MTDRCSVPSEQSEPRRSIMRTVAVWLATGFVMVLSFFSYGMLMVAAKSTSVRSPPLITVLIPFAFGVVWVSVLLSLLAGLWDLLHFAFGPQARWTRATCPDCGHPMPPKTFDGTCLECGSALALQRQPPLHLFRRTLRLATVAVIGAITAHLWLSVDLLAFRRSTAVHPTIAHSRPRAWPFDAGGLSYRPESGVSARD